MEQNGGWVRNCFDEFRSYFLLPKLNWKLFFKSPFSASQDTMDKYQVFLYLYTKYFQINMLEQKK